ALADDNDARWTDVTIDIGEHRSVPDADVREMRAIAAERTVRSFRSSVHLHLTRDAGDKASGTISLLGARFGADPTAARVAYGFVGHSEHDAPCFAAFTTTFGVANVRRYVRRLSVPPRFVTGGEMGLGFAELAAYLVAQRPGGPRKSSP